MKKHIPGLLFLLASILISCSPDSADEDNQSPSNSKLVQKEFVSDNYNLQYRYNESRLLSQITDVFSEEEIHDIISFKYDSNKNVIERHFDSQNSSYQSTTTYQYDNQNRIIRSEKATTMENSNTTFEFSYNGNSVEVVENNSGYEGIINLELNETGLVTRISESAGYSTFNYDAQGNLKKIQTYDEGGGLKFTHEYLYDDKSNPFYGQLSSLYLPNFLEIMDDLYYGEDLLFPYQG
ncbi:MAG: hypothetical protein R3218_06970, partial [Christiangramia sp.]|nr:hypothetical protein [Christiangramia sp.]